MQAIHFAKWFSSELLFTLRAIKWFLSEFFFTLRATECAKKLSEHIWLVAAQTSSFNGFEPAQMKPALNLSQVDEWPEDISELDKCFYEPASIIVTPGKRKRI